MKRTILSLILVLATFSAVAQADDTTIKFLGIPIDGKKSDMISALKAKGFVFDATTGILSGKFNGKESHIHISENYGKVDRVMVADANTVDEAQIITNYNNLLYWFENSNGKYFSLFPNEPIPEDEHISYEMTIRNKRYSASFMYNPIYDNESLKQKILEEAKEECDMAITEQKDKIVPGFEQTYGEYYDDEDNYNEYISTVAGLKVLRIAKGTVWFSIARYGSEYYICIYYDNLNNRPNGDDL